MFEKLFRIVPIGIAGEQTVHYHKDKSLEKKMEEKNRLLQIVLLANKKQKEGKCLKPEQVEKFLNDRMKVRRVSKNEYITTEYMEEEKVYYVLSGSFLMMRTSKDGKNNVMDLKRAPQFLGIDKAVMPEEEYTFSDNLAKEDCLVLEVERGYFIRSLKEEAELGFEIIKVLCRRLVIASYRADRALFYTNEEQLMIYLMAYWSNHHDGRYECTVKLKNSYIAEEIGISIRGFYRTVDKLKKESLLTVEKGNIVVTQDQIKEMGARCGDFMNYKYYFQ